LQTLSRLLAPPLDLSGCLFSAIVRDTRGVRLDASDRLNYFPASPLVTVTYVAEGEIRLMASVGGVEPARTAVPLPRISVTPPQDAPTLSWCPGPVHAISVGVYPDAWRRLSRDCDLRDMLASACATHNEMSAAWRHFCDALRPRWRQVRGLSFLPEWSQAARLSAWSRGLVTRFALAGRGKSLRAVEQRIKRWTGQTRRSLAFYAAFEDLHRLSVQAGNESLADLAVAGGYSDQSHMGRAVRRATGFSPARLNRLIETEEAFWCYRLLGERF